MLAQFDFFTGTIGQNQGVRRVENFKKVENLETLVHSRLSA